MNKNQSRNSSIVTWIMISINMILLFYIIITNVVRTKEIVYVDALQLISKYKGMEVARKELETKSSIWQSNLDTLKKEMEIASRDYERAKKSVSARELKLMQELVAAKQQQFVNYQETVKSQYQSEDKAKSEKILNAANDYIRRYGEGHHYTIILAATSYGNIAYADKSLDITEEVLKGLNEEYGKVK